MIFSLLASTLAGLLQNGKDFDGAITELGNADRTQTESRNTDRTQTESEFDRTRQTR